MAGSGFTLQLNGANDLNISNDGNYTFLVALDDITEYIVTIKTQPSNLEQTCRLSNARSTLSGSNIDNVIVSCETNSYSIGGSVTGLKGSGLILRNNGADDLPVASNMFIFSTSLIDGSDYGISVFQQPTLANATIDCKVANGAGRLIGADISTISIVCTTTYTVNVTVSGFSTGNSMVLRNNGADDLPLSADGFYTISTGLTDGTSYNVTIATPAAVLKTRCNASNGVGIIAGAAITNVAVNCIDDIAPLVSSTTPTNAAIGVAVGTLINATFDEDMLATSFAMDALTVADTVGPITGLVGYDVTSRTLSIIPDLPLALSTPYTVTLSNAITDQSGQTLNSIPWTFTTAARNRLWAAAQLVETDNLGSARFPIVVLDPKGNGLAVWEQFDGTEMSIWANRFDVSTKTWGSAEKIETYDLGYATSPQIAMDASGNALVVWYQNLSTSVNSIWANRYDVTTNTWGVAELIHTDIVGNALFPQIAVDPFGNGTAVWQQFDGLRYNIWANRFSVTTSAWGTAELIETVDIKDAAKAQIELDEAGNGLAVWKQYDGVKWSIWSNRFNVTTSKWETAQLLEVNDNGSVLEPQIALDPAGNGIAVWGQQKGTVYSIMANRFDATSKSWGGAQLIETEDLGDAWFPQIALSTAGHGIAVWYQNDNTNITKIWVNHFDLDPLTNKHAWGTAKKIESNTEGASYPKIALDTAGNALVLWQQWDGARYNIWTNRYVNSTKAWANATLFETELGNTADYYVAFDPVGNGMVVWEQFDGMQDSIFSRRFE